MNIDIDELLTVAIAATPGPWKWFTSNSHQRLSSIPSGRDGDVIYAFRAVDGKPCVGVTERDMNFIAMANPEIVKALCERIKELESRKFVVKLPDTIGWTFGCKMYLHHDVVIAIRKAGGEIEE